MGLFDRFFRPRGYPEAVAMAEVLRTRLGGEFPGSMDDLAELDRDVAGFVARTNLSALEAAALQWATGPVSDERLLTVAVVFANGTAFQQNVAALGRRPDQAGTGILVLQDAFNRIGLVLGPTAAGQIRAEETGARRPVSDPIAALADVIHPKDGDEQKLIRRLAELAKAEPSVVAGELLALRAHAFQIGVGGALGPESDRYDGIADQVFTYLGIGLRELMNADSGWFAERQAQYAVTVPTDPSMPRSRFAAVWIAGIRVAFGRALGTNDRSVGFLGAGAFDRAMNRSAELVTALG